MSLVWKYDGLLSVDKFQFAACVLVFQVLSVAPDQSKVTLPPGVKEIKLLLQSNTTLWRPLIP